jgi:hypothetical protein
MRLELHGHDTRLLLSDEEWNRGIQQLVVEGREIPFLLNALSGVHFFTGAWPRPAQAIDYEPQVSPGTLTRVSERSALWHQPETAYTHVETKIEYEIVGRGTVEARFETRSHAATYPYGYVGLFWGTVAPPGGQRGMHLLVPGPKGRLRWHYFQGGGDCWSVRANTVLGPDLPSAAHHPEHGPAYFFAEAARRFALPVQIARWQDLSYSLEVDSQEVGFSNVLLATAIGGPSWSVHWRLRPGEARTVCCRVTVGPWKGWEAVEQRYRSWHGCVDPTFETERTDGNHLQPFARPVPVESAPDRGLALSRKLFETRGRQLLERLDLLNRCAVGCLGGTSQNTGLDDPVSRDHMWGPYLTFLLRQEDWENHGDRLQQAIRELPDEIEGARWRGYDGPEPRKTAAWEIQQYLRMLTGLEARPRTDREWLPYLRRSSFLGRRWAEQLSDAGQGQVFHDPGQHFTELWRHWTGYVPPDIHRALLARSLFRVWNAGPEYNLNRAHARGDRLSFALCLHRFIEEVLELAFCWNERFVPPFKWRAARFRRLPICPHSVRDGIQSFADTASDAERLEIAQSVVKSIKVLMKDLYHLPPGLKAELSDFAHAMHGIIEDEEVRRQTPLEW